MLVDEKIKSFAERILLLKNQELEGLPNKLRKEIEACETRYIIYVKDFKESAKGNSCKGIYFLPYSHKKFKNIINKLNKTFSQYGEIEVFEESYKIRKLEV